MPSAVVEVVRPICLTIAVLGGLIVRVRQPAALGIPFVRGG